MPKGIVSLTVNHGVGDDFEVNLEIGLIARYVERMMAVETK